MISVFVIFVPHSFLMTEVIYKIGMFKMVKKWRQKVDLSYLRGKSCYITLFINSKTNEPP